MAEGNAVSPQSLYLQPAVPSLYPAIRGGATHPT